jgi:hypothetical protein
MLIIPYALAVAGGVYLEEEESEGDYHVDACVSLVKSNGEHTSCEEIDGTMTHIYACENTADEWGWSTFVTCEVCPSLKSL